jgi:predicted nucleic acid-binding Zn ribbon protein
MSDRDFDNDDIDREAPDESDMDDSDEPLPVECPFCAKTISEDAERCHHCGNYIVPELQRGSGTMGPWIIAGAALAIVAVLTWVLL